MLCREDLRSHLQALGKRLHALRDALSDVQDIVDAPITALWDAQLQRVLDANLAKELRCFAPAQARDAGAGSGSQPQGPVTFVGR